MGKSGNPKRRASQEDEARAAVQAAQLKISPIGDFKKRLGGVMELPSGLIVRVKNPGGMTAFLAGGLIPNALMPIIQKALEQGNTKEDGSSFLNDKGGIDPSLMEDMVQLLNRVAEKVIVEPRINPVPENEDDRSDEELYADEIPDDDKMFLFQWLSGGTSDLATFRRERDQGVDHLAQVAKSRGATE